MDLFSPSFDVEPYTRRGENLREICFPLGGIGSGCVSLDGRGGLVDWEIFGRPNKGCQLEYTFPALWYREEGAEAKALSLLGPRLQKWQGESNANWDFGSGRFFKQMDGLPGFHKAEFAGTFPIARVSLERPNCPLEITLAAFSPFIPHDVPNSSFPGLYLVYKVMNRSGKPVEGSIAWSMMNPVGEMDRSNREHGWINKAFVEGPFRGISFGNEGYESDDLHAGEAVLATHWGHVEIGDRWSVEGWWDSVRAFWTGFRNEGHVQNNLGKESDRRRAPGTLACRFSLQPGESAEIPFVIAWRFPNSVKYWGEEKPALGKHHYATVWPTAVAAAVKMLGGRERLTDGTLAFEQALYDSSLPTPVLESIGATASILVTPTVTRLEDGTFWSWEGCSATEGCCDGSCSHVWNYALTHAYLFPRIQRNYLDTAFAHTFRCGPEGELGAMNFRVQLPLGVDSKLWHAASDGQLGQIVQIYREWRLTGDSDWLKSIYPHAKKAFGYAWVKWDVDQDGLVEGDMHNTYDINFCTPNPLTQFFYLAALKAMAGMAEFVGDQEFGQKCAGLAEVGSKLTAEKLWTGSFFRQLADFTPKESPRYQHGAGCLSDQLFGQLSASIAGLGDLVPPGLIETALLSIFKYNFRSELGDHENLQRYYASHDEGGLILCSWPDGEEPAYPFPYSDEVWTGIEYQVASHLVLTGHKEEALKIVKAIRHRYDGTRRNPWNEFECGSHYARALASYGLLLGWTGFRQDAITGEKTFTKEPFKALWSAPHAWGTAERKADGSLELTTLGSANPGDS